jgi:type VI secretion system secreted protein VgrG
MAFTQSNREIELKTPLGSDVLLLSEMSMKEELGRLFEIDLRLYSTVENIKFEDLLGQNITIHLLLPAGGKRYFNGYVNSMSQQANEGSFAVYQLKVRPWLWFLTRTTDCRIFQNQSVPDIIKSIFRDLGFTDFEEKLNGSYRNWEYCVQYRETDFNFVSRLMEQEGIYYYFEHVDGKHTLILADGYGSHEPIPSYESISYMPLDDTRVRDSEYITELMLSKAIQPGVYTLDDFDFKRPKTDLTTDSTVPREHNKADYEVFDYPGEYLDVDDGANYVRARIEELHAQYEQISGAGDARGLISGGLFSLQDYPREDQNREYLVVSVEHTIHSDEYEASGNAEGSVYTNEFLAVEGKTPYRTARTTAKPIVQGPQTAIVVGPSGDEIHTDDYGRVKLQFHWDRYGKSDENSSCWVRVSQLWAGKTWGGIHIPRIGQEVIVEFLEGDPDRPIVTGRVYNADQMPPYELPANKTQSGIKSRSSQGGSGSNFNEIRFEDKKGSEQLYLHAEKNQDIVVENDETHFVGHDRKKKVDNDEDNTIGNNRTEKVAVDEKIDIGSNRTETVGGKENITIGASRVKTVGADETITIGANRTETVGGSENLTIAANWMSNVGASWILNVGASATDTIGGSYMKTVGGACNITSAGPMTLKAGGGLVLLAPAGTKMVDSFLTKLGGDLTETYGKIVKGTPLKMEGTSVAIESKGLNVEMGNLKTLKFGTALQKMGAQLLKTDSAYLNKAGISLAKAGIHLIG